MTRQRRDEDGGAGRWRGFQPSSPHVRPGLRPPRFPPGTARPRRAGISPLSREQRRAGATAHVGGPGRDSRASPRRGPRGALGRSRRAGPGQGAGPRRGADSRRGGDCGSREHRGGGRTGGARTAHGPPSPAPRPSPPRTPVARTPAVRPSRRPSLAGRGKARAAPTGPRQPPGSPRLPRCAGDREGGRTGGSCPASARRRRRRRGCEGRGVLRPFRSGSLRRRRGARPERPARQPISAQGPGLARPIAPGGGPLEAAGGARGLGALGPQPQVRAGSPLLPGGPAARRSDAEPAEGAPAGRRAGLEAAGAKWERRGGLRGTEPARYGEEPGPRRPGFRRVMASGRRGLGLRCSL